jgi:rhamnogalacturonyl hydrolase YesR
MRRAMAVGGALAIAAMLTPAARPVVPSLVTASVGLPRHSTIVNATKRAADYYRTTYAHTTLLPKAGWSWATYSQGVQALYRQAGDAAYLSDGLAWGRSNSWHTTTREIDPDLLKAGQTYFDLNAIDRAASLAAMDATMANDLVHQPLSRYDWEDALFMGLPVWTRWAKRTGQVAYFDRLDALYAWARDSGATSARCRGRTVPQTGLYDAAQGLWYRDCTFVGVRDSRGQPIFWARGNGWVIAAMAQVLESLPPGGPRAVKYASMLRTMAARLLQAQGSDGLWRASLADAALYPQPETSGTALITYALASGIARGILDRATYLPAVARAWQGLTTISLQPNGFVTNCQGPGGSPGASYLGHVPRIAPTSTSSGTVNADSPPYCVGAFLLAGSAVARLPNNLSAGRPVTFTGQQVGHEARRVNDGDVTTRWSASGFPKAVTIDLGADHLLTNSMVVPYAGRAYRFRIETSTDKVHWRLAIDHSTTRIRGSRLDDFPSGAVAARYARLTVTGVYATATIWAGIQEFAVY